MTASVQETEAELIQLRAENDALKALLAQHGITAPQPSSPDIGDSVPQPNANALSPHAKVILFRRLFRGREDIYPVRWTSTTTGKSGYSPHCTNKWQPGICKLPTIKCSECSHNLYAPVTDYTIRQHLRGKITAGVYPLLVDHRCYFLAIDFVQIQREHLRASTPSGCGGIVRSKTVQNSLPGRRN